MFPSTADAFVGAGRRCRRSVRPFRLTTEGTIIPDFVTPSPVDPPADSCPDPASVRTGRLLEYNLLLEADAAPFRLTENLLERKLEQLMLLATNWERISSLTLARLNELALLCAGNYADGCEFTAAGDLLVNPRCIFVHVQGLPDPVRKRRHGSLTHQFRRSPGTGQDIVSWLKLRTTLEIRQKPLLPHLYGLLESSGCISEAYLESAGERMERIAGAIGFLSSWHLRDDFDLYSRLELESPSERKFIESSLCRFDLGTFVDLGQDVQQLAKDRTYRSRFLR